MSNIGEEVLPEGKGIIYVVTDIENNKLYIGQSTKPLRDRWKGHIRFSKSEESTYPLAEAIKAKGMHRFYVNIIEIIDIDKLHEREKFWIDTLRTHVSQNGYNVTEGGIDGNKVVTDNAKILEVYAEVKSIRETAKILGISRDVVSSRIKSSGAEVFNMSEIRGKPLKLTSPNGEIEYFVSKIELARWIVDNNIGKVTSVSSARRIVKNEEKVNYYGYVIESNL